MTNKGMVKYPYYKTNGEHVTRGLRNKRSAHRARLQKIALIEKERKLREQENKDNQFSDDYGWSEKERT